MSTEQDKIRHSRRLQKDHDAVERQVKIAKSHGVTVTEPHKYAKHHAMNCGVPGCGLCENRRKYGEKTIQEQRLEQDTGWIENDEHNDKGNNNEPV
jgi:hypothetical protein